jgi:hypothetical protein
VDNKSRDPDPKHKHEQGGPAIIANHRHYYGYYEIKVDSLIGKDGRYQKFQSNGKEYKFIDNKTNRDSFKVGKTLNVYKVIDSISEKKADIIVVLQNYSITTNRNVNNNGNSDNGYPKARGRLGCIPTFEFDENDRVVHQSGFLVKKKVIFYVADHKHMNQHNIVTYFNLIKFKISNRQFQKLNEILINDKKCEGGLEGPSQYCTADKSNLLVLYDKSGNKVDSVNLIPIP